MEIPVGAREGAGRGAFFHLVTRRRKRSSGGFHPERSETLVVTRVAEEGRKMSCHQLGRGLIIQKLSLCLMVGRKKITTIKQRDYKQIALI